MNKDKLMAEYINAENPETAFKNNQNYTFKKRIVSFGKLFTLFIGDALIQLDEIDEVQLWFYKLNDHCGPASSINIAEFPIELSAFVRKYTDYVYQNRTQNITVRDFLNLVISSQFTDPRALGFGMRQYYEAYDPKKPDPSAKESAQKQYESALAARQREYGTFIYPAIQVMFETVHARADNAALS